MAKNDVILLDGILAERGKSETLDKGELFELFAFEQILKSYDLTRSELEHGWVDGHNDGGIDGYYTFVNGALVTDPSKFQWPRKSVRIDVVIINCKHKDAFKQEPLNTIFPTLEELLDFGKAPEEFDGQYSKQIIDARQCTVQAFRSTASTLPTLNFRLVYATRGDDVEANVEARGNQLKRVVSDYFSAAEISVEYVGATELVEQHRKNKFILQLPYAEQLAGEHGAYIMLVRLAAYNSFIRDDHGNLRRYLFDSNVRDFLGENRVNQEILSTLEEANSPEFWWLNNGITILATSAIPLGKTPDGNALQLHDVQIVNGLQTTQTIHNFFQSGSAQVDDQRCVLVKVIVSEDTAIRDKIIRATNNQSSVELASLTATDKIQRDIEAILEQEEWFYERRKNYYKNIGKPAERFVAPLYLAVGVVALVRKCPQRAGRLKSSFMKHPESYDAVFSENFPISIWPKIASLLKLVDQGIGQKLPKRRKNGARIVASLRGAVALCAVAEILGHFDYSIAELLDVDMSKLSEQRIGEIFEYFTSTEVVAQPPRGRTDLICMQFAAANSLGGAAEIGRWRLPADLVQPYISGVRAKADSPPLDEEKVRLVAGVLPPQPWKPGVQQQVAEKTGLSLTQTKRAIKRLIDQGEFHNQIQGVVFDKNRVIVAIDHERANTQQKIGDVLSPTGETGSERN
ncbi:AIPR family protein [Pseudacidovorax intermedius]|uniref:AIPR family protein n=1 Tax=Pseudacidovorax intermedius TaxID=433924 RepID=UPI000344EF9E|nr:AIPR family protein [Pseudacidovorax intermedius]